MIQDIETGEKLKVYGIRYCDILRTTYFLVFLAGMWLWVDIDGYEPINEI